MAQTTTPTKGIGKKELCAALGWSRPTLDARLKRDPKFPVLFAKGRVWQFDLAAVCRYIGRPVPGESPPKVADASVPRVPSDDDDGGYDDEHLTAKEATARQRRDLAQAQLLEDKLRLQRSELLEVEDVRAVLGVTMSHISNALDGLPDQIVKLIGLPEEESDRIRTLVDDIRNTLAKDLTGLATA